MRKAAAPAEMSERNVQPVRLPASDGLEPDDVALLPADQVDRNARTPVLVRVAALLR